MKTKFISLFAVLSFAVSFLFTACSNEKEQAGEQKARNTASTNKRSELPRLPLTDLSGSRFMANSLEGKTVLVLYQPECEDCQREAAQISEHLPAFKDYEVYFVSDASLPVQAEFAKNYRLDNNDNIHFAQASVNDIINTLGPIPAPSLFIFSADGQLVKGFKGETDIQQIIRHL
jgi:peroxiredoxin